MVNRSLSGIRQAFLIPLLALVNIFLGFFVSGYNVLTQRISELALETAWAAYTHRLTDILIGVSMAIFAVSCLRLVTAVFTCVTMSLFALTWIFAGIFILGSPLHDIYGLTTVLLVIPVVFVLEIRGRYYARWFEVYSVFTTLAHVLIFWFFNDGYMPQDYIGLIQRLWVLLTLVWYGVAAYHLLRIHKQAGVKSFVPSQA